VGLVQHLMKRIKKGPVRGISLKLQEEERERRMDYVPDESAVNLENIEVRRCSKSLFKITSSSPPPYSPSALRRMSGLKVCL
jgi:small subunit ribosomal protein S17e